MFCRIYYYHKPSHAAHREKERASEARVTNLAAINSIRNGKSAQLAPFSLQVSGHMTYPIVICGAQPHPDHTGEEGPDKRSQSATIHDHLIRHAPICSV